MVAKIKPNGNFMALKLAPFKLKKKSAELKIFVNYH